MQCGPPFTTTWRAPFMSFAVRSAVAEIGFPTVTYGMEYLLFYSDGRFCRRWDTVRSLIKHYGENGVVRICAGMVEILLNSCSPERENPNELRRDRVRIEVNDNPRESSAC